MQLLGQLFESETRLLADAFGRLQSGRAAEAIALFERLLKDNPRMFDVWELYSQALLEMGIV